MTGISALALYVVLGLVGLYVLYRVVRAAVRDGVRDARRDPASTGG